jgi:hypothetical protein
MAMAPLLRLAVTLESRSSSRLSQTLIRLLQCIPQQREWQQQQMMVICV